MTIKVKKRNFLKKKKIKEIKNELGEYGELLQNKKNVEILEAEPDSFILVDGEPYIILIDEKPFLQSFELLDKHFQLLPEPLLYQVLHQ